jgi:hypothetical protein
MKLLVSKLIINKYYLLFFLIFIGGFFVDVSMGVLKDIGVQEEGGAGSLGQIWRVMILVLMFILLKKNIKYAVTILSFFIITELFSGVFHQNAIGAIVGISQGVKILYTALLFFIMAEFINEYRSDGLRLLARIMIYYELLIAIMLYISFFCGIGFSSYGQNVGQGTSGFFTGANALGFTFGSLVALNSIFLNEGVIKHNFKNTIIFLFSAFSLLFIGTKVSIVYFLIVFYIFNIRLFFTLFSFVLITIIFFYDLDVENLGQFSTVASRVAGNPEIIPSLMGSRAADILDAFNSLNIRDNPLRFIVGGGGFLSYQAVSSVPIYDILEADFFDILFMYGLHGVIFYCLFFILLVSRAINIKRAWPLGLFIFINSATGGHVILNGQSAAALALVFVSISYLSKQKYKLDI